MTSETQTPARIWAFEDEPGGVPSSGIWFDEQCEAPAFATEYTRADMAAKVKPLPWERASEALFERGHCMGEQEEIAYLDRLDWYRIYPVSNGRWLWVRQFRMVAIAGISAKGNLASADEAKADAQADYERCYMAGLELAPVTPQQAAKVLVNSLSEQGSPLRLIEITAQRAGFDLAAALHAIAGGDAENTNDGDHHV